MRTFENFNELLEVAQADKPKSKFSAIVANPPYQVNTGGENNSGAAYSVWPEFIYVASYVAAKASFINPARWQRGGSGTGLLPIRNYFFTSKHLTKFITLPDSKVFPGVGIGDICIEFLEFDKITERPMSGVLENDTLSYSEYNPNSLVDILLDQENEALVVKILEANIGPNFESMLWIGGQDNHTKTITSRPATNPHKQHDYGLMGHRIASDPDYFTEKENLAPDIDYVKIYYSPGALRFDFKFLLKSELEETRNNKERTSKWKVLIPKTNAHFFYRNLGPIAEPDSLCTNTWVCRSFDSELECVNFQSYLKTYFYRFLVSIRGVSHNAMANVHRFVPDLATVTNPRTGLVGYQSDWTDEDLKELFEDVLTDADWAYIEKTAIESDPAGAKR